MLYMHDMVPVIACTIRLLGLCQWTSFTASHPSVSLGADRNRYFFYLGKLAAFFGKYRYNCVIAYLAWVISLASWLQV